MGWMTKNPMTSCLFCDQQSYLNHIRKSNRSSKRYIITLTHEKMDSQGEVERFFGSGRSLWLGVDGIQWSNNPYPNANHGAGIFTYIIAGWLLPVNVGKYSSTMSIWVRQWCFALKQEMKIVWPEFYQQKLEVNQQWLDKHYDTNNLMFHPCSDYKLWHTHKKY